MKLIKLIKRLFKPKIIKLENLSTTHYTYPVQGKIVNETGKDGWYIANGIVFGDAELKRDKKVLLMKKTGEIRIATVICGGDFCGPVFDHHETLVTHEILAVEI